MLIRRLSLLITLLFVSGAQSADIEKELESLKKKVEQLEAKQEAQRTESDNVDIKLGGAVRFQYSYEDYNEGNRERGGDLDFDIFRLNLDGSIGDVILSAEYRWFQYMNAIHHAWVGYNFDTAHQAKIGVTKVPFGIQSYASHNYFFSSNYYVGLEDDYDLGVNYTYQEDGHKFDLAFYKNDELGGIDGYVSDRSDRYSYDIVGVRLSNEGNYDTPTLAASENNTINVRYANTFQTGDWSIELGASAQYGDVEVQNNQSGSHQASALHSVLNYDRWNIHLQATQYKYDIDNMPNMSMAVGAYAFYDTIASEADSYIANVAYSLPVSIGPISNLTFYNNYTLVTNKSEGLADTYMNVTGVAVSAGGLYAYFDYVVAENQPFIGGSMAGNGDDESRFNINFGYYF